MTGLSIFTWQKFFIDSTGGYLLSSLLLLGSSSA